MCWLDLKKRSGTPNCKRILETEFEREGYLFRIPAVYFCPEGIVIDLCKRVSHEAAEAFESRYRKAKESGASVTELCGLIDENPLSIRLNPELCLGEKHLRMAQAWTHCFGRNRMEEDDETAEEYMETYACSREWDWAFYSVLFKREETADAEELRLILKKEKRDFLCTVEENQKFFTTGAEEEEGRQIRFRDPVTGRQHTLEILGVSQDERLETSESLPAGFREKYLYPTWFQKLEYRLEDEAGNFFIQDKESSDAPIPIAESNRAASIGIIGTALHILSDSDRKCVCSGLRFEPQNEVRWEICRRAECGEEQEIVLKYREK